MNDIDKTEKKASVSKDSPGFTVKPVPSTKTAAQLSCFFSHARFLDSRTRVECLMIARSSTPSGFAGGTPLYDREHGMTLENFLDWLENGFGAGDTVKLRTEDEEMLGICGICDENGPEIALILSDDKLVIPEKSVDFKAILRPNPEEAAKMRGKALKNRLFVDPYTGRITYIPEIRRGDTVHYEELGGGREGIGIVSHVWGGALWFLCSVENGRKPEIYALPENCGVGLLGFRVHILNNNKRSDPGKLPAPERKILLERFGQAMERCGYRWNPDRQIIEGCGCRTWADWREYWYVDECFGVRRAVVAGPRDTLARKRWEAGNFFTAKPRADRFALAVARISCGITERCAWNDMPAKKEKMESALKIREGLEWMFEAGWGEEGVEGPE